MVFKEVPVSIQQMAIQKLPSAVWQKRVSCLRMLPDGRNSFCKSKMKETDPSKEQATWNCNTHLKASGII